MPFARVVGHRRLATLVSRAIAQDTLPPALLLAGPAGVGKRLIAVAIAEALNCLQPRLGGEFERDGCGVCAACRRIARGVHPDVLTLVPGEMGSIKIEQVREVIDKAGYRPFEGRRRVVIFDEADALVVPAQNALLKTLEEPPSASIFLLVSSVPDALLPTVLSRCHRLRFGPLSAADVALALTRDHGLSELEARALAAESGGSIGGALAAQSADVTEARDAARSLLERVARISDPVRRLEAARELTDAKVTGQAERDHLSVFLRTLASLLRDIGVLSNQGDTRMLTNTDLEADLARLTQAFGSERSASAFAAVDRALAALERNVSPKLVADWLVLQL